MKIDRGQREGHKCEYWRMEVIVHSWLETDVGTENVR